MPVTDLDTGSPIPQPPAHAWLHDGSNRIEFTKHGIRTAAVLKPLLCFPDNVHAEITEVTWFGDRHAFSVSDDRSYSGSAGECILNELDLLKIEQIGKLHIADLLQRTGEG